ncbi:TrbI/VirB10 family protein [Sphingomonas sp. LB-2]|uniref:TrbI/VirB10 family protein n=1 Tax=Sphingomonas caeni TaxID=2984949 RepID=UPI002230E0F2|nr:TrbI/VirB10 family protein [Sphingomonas caeni]MCW3848254.1 TrbI/VirB10 family protein [Sphingomonas caeni]
MATVPPGDPRVAASGNGGNVAPMVALPRGGPSWIVIAIGMAILGVLLFSVLDSRRRAAEVPAVRAGSADRAAGAVSAAPPSLYVPPAPPPPAPAVTVQPEPVRQLPPPPPQIVYVPQPAPVQQQPVEMPAPPPRTSAEPALVFDGTGADAGPAAPTTADKEGATEGTTPGTSAASVAGSRARSGVLANRSTTVPQGTLIPAVLETGLDSTRPGLARAMVTRDVRGFDGTRILIPRGSRLIGEYRSEAQPGQKRALVNWVRLIRPDGVTIAIGSPAGDPLGRGGIGASVNNHFFARFTGAILQSVLDVGVNLASRTSGSPIVVALPGTVQNVTGPLQQNQQVTPTLTVKPGTSITIFVARDLDFTGAGARR